MNKMIAAASFAIAILAGAGTAYAGSMVGQGIPSLTNQPIVSLSAPTVTGEAYPAFGAADAPVISAQPASQFANEGAPNFAVPKHASRFAQAQIGIAQD